MITGLDEMQKMGKDNMDLAMRSFGSVSKGFQTVATEMADYSKKSFEDGAAAFEKMLAAKTFDKALEVQTDYVRSAYEGFVAQATKFGELYADMAKDAYKPLEGFVGKTPASK